MSETDDTDVLIRCPPDFFSIDTSDSESSVDYRLPVRRNENDQSVERMVVNDLLNQVNDLENRICVIEKKDGIETNHLCNELDLTQTASSSSHFNSVEPLKRVDFGQSLDNLKICNTKINHTSTPVKSRKIFSLPSTPQNHVYNFSSIYRKSHSSPRDITKQNIGSKDVIVSSNCKINLDSNMPYTKKPGGTSGSNFAVEQNSNDRSSEGHIKQNKPIYNPGLMDEIDQFINSGKKSVQVVKSKNDSSEQNRRDNFYKCGENSSSVPNLSFGLRDFKSLPVREEPVVAKHFSPLEPASANDPKHFNLSEVDKLLKEMEETQQQIEKKLQLKESQFGKGDGKTIRDHASFPIAASLCGDNIGSVPDLRFGLREHMASKTEEASARVPVHEDRVIKRSMSLCGVNPPGQTNISTENQQKKVPQLETSSSKSLIPRRLELGNDPSSIPNLGFGLIDWYKNSDSASNLAQTATVRPETVSQSPRKYIQGENPSSIPDLGFGLRDLWADGMSGVSTGSTQSEPQLALKVNQKGVHSVFQPALTTTLEHATIFKPSNEHNKLASEPLCKRKVDFLTESGFSDKRVLQQEYGSEKNVRSNGNVLSLSNLYGHPTNSINSEQNNSVKLVQRIEEEKYRREHCERLILELQRRLLEEEQKLAVAIQVDLGKDQAIDHFQGAWNRLVSHWNELEEQRHSLAVKLQESKEQYQRDFKDTVDKLKRYELEVSKALDLAHGYKQKSEFVEEDKQKLELKSQGEIQELNERVKESDIALAKANQENKLILQEKDELLKRLWHLEENHKKEKGLLQNEKKELYKKLNVYEADCMALKEEKASLQLTLKEEKTRNNLLDLQKNGVQTALDESKKKEKSLREELKTTSGNLEKLKGELRDFYQEQVEIVVRDKLQEFQGQLDEAEKSLHHEMEIREQAITGIATKQVKQMSDRHQMEIKILEDKHKEELKLYHHKLAQSTHHINKLQTKLKSYNSRKGEIADQLHDVMETQWQQALRIIHGNSPMAPQPLPTNNMESNNYGTWPKPLNSLTQVDNNGTKDIKFDQHLHMSQQKTNASSTNNIPPNKDGQATHRISQDSSSTNNGKEKQRENDLKKYIEMLLNRSPGVPVLDDSTPNGQWQPEKQNGEHPTNDTSKKPQWELDGYHQLQMPEFDLSRISLNSASKDLKTGKPPWK